MDSHRIVVNKITSPMIIKLWLVMLCLFALISCASSPRGATPESPCAVFENSDSISIAVLPFVDRTGTNDIAQIVRNAFYCHLSVRRFQDIELHVVDEILRQNGLSDPDTISGLSVKELGQLLQTDALVLGEITNYQKMFLGVYSQMAVGATISIWDTRSGQKVWSDKHIARLHEGGIPFSLFEVPFISFRSGYNLRERVKMRTVDELTRTLTERVPDPTSPLYTSQVTGNCPEIGTEITDFGLSTHRQSLSDKTGGLEETIPPMF